MIPGVVLGMLLAVGVVQPAKARPCRPAIDAGFDSRLKPEPLGMLPVRGKKPVGFEVVKGRPTVALEDELLVLGTESVASIAPPGPVHGIAVDTVGDLLIQTARGVFKPGPTGFEPEARMSPAGGGTLYNAGSEFYLEIRKVSAGQELILHAKSGPTLPVARVQGAIRALSWNGVGLALVVDRRLLVWERGGEKLVQLASDIGLENARDVCLQSANKAIVALNNVVVAVGPGYLTPVVGMRARGRWSNGALFLLDERTGAVWSIRGIEALGPRAQDDAHARRLLNSLPRGASENDVRFLEAARLLGCEKARAAR